MLRKFKISIDGKEYLVEMEEIGGVPQPVQAAPVQATPVQAASVAAPAEPTPEAPTTPAGADAMESPMPAKVLRIIANVGDQVKENDELLVLEAMKMEVKIVAGKAGTVSGIHVNKGDNVNAGDPLVTIS